MNSGSYGHSIYNWDIIVFSIDHTKYQTIVIRENGHQAHTLNVQSVLPETKNLHDGSKTTACTTSS